MTRLPYRFIRLLMLLIATCYSRVEGFWFFSCPHGNGQGQAGDVCSAFCSCHQPNTCEAGIQRCARPGLQGERCHATRPCAPAFSCHPGVQKCFHVPRRHGEPCVAGFECGTGLSCEPGVQVSSRPWGNSGLLQGAFLGTKNPSLNLKKKRQTNEIEFCGWSHPSKKLNSFDKCPAREETTLSFQLSSIVLICSMATVFKGNVCFPWRIHNFFLYISGTLANICCKMSVLSTF